MAVLSMDGNDRDREHDRARTQHERQLELELASLQSQIREMSTKLLLAADRNADLEDEVRIARSNATLATARCDALEEALERSSGRHPAAQGTHVNGWAAAVDGGSFLGRKTTKPKTLREMLGWKQAALRSNPTSLLHGESSSAPGLTRSTSEPMGLSSGSNGTLLLEQVEHMDLDTLRRTLQMEHSLRKRAEKQVAEIQDELESLSQSLFEEANTMVATARMEGHLAKEELSQCKKELERLRPGPGPGSGLGARSPALRLEIPRSQTMPSDRSDRLGAIPKTSPIVLSPLDTLQPLSSKSTRLDLLMNDLELMMDPPTSRPRTAS